MKKAWQVTLLLIAFSGFAAAAPLCSEVATTAQSFQALGRTGCQFGDKIFYNFTYTYTLQDANGNSYAGDANNPNVTAADVSVAFSDLNGDPYEPVVSFTSSPSWQVFGGVAGDIRINYDVLAPSPHNAYEATLAANGSLTNVDPANQFAPYISIAESLAVNGQAGGVNLGLELDPPATTTPTPFATSRSDSQSFSDSSILAISKDVFLSSGSGTNEAILTRIDQGLYEVGAAPEPLSVALLGGGLVLLGLVGRSKGKGRQQ
ncbi:MAG: hypothetical protein P4L56_23185 [Candidatus Sulfopaludibacter sp.]|nr:hypothetical protein [Candidatus Sulfopaludibacter sp.]